MKDSLLLGSISLSNNSVDQGFSEWTKSFLNEQSDIWNHVISLLSDNELQVALEIFREKTSYTIH